MTVGRGKPRARARADEPSACFPDAGPRGSYGPHKAELLRRLRRIEGQVRGVQRMVEQEKYCVDVLVQIAAVKAALDKVGLSLLEDHTRGCVTKAIRSGDEKSADHSIRELMDVVLRFVKGA